MVGPVAEDAAGLSASDADRENQHPDGDTSEGNALPLTQDELRTLKHRLAGPSITKAGQDLVDQKKVSEIIYNVSKGSKFFNNEENKDRALTGKIERILARKRQLEKLDLSNDLRKADNYIAALELERDLTQTIVHLDCDAFYAAVEELDKPWLKDVPFSVGKGVLTTCNYHARQFGCRSGMAGFVAKALCPQLVQIPLDFTKYTAKAAEVRAVIERYDPRYESASIDEAYLNITAYLAEHDMSTEEAVQQLRREVFAECEITVSGGIASNAKLAKICSNRNKPNGQFRVPPERAAIMAFMRDLPVRKVNGVGRVFERELDAVGIKTCGDIYAHRAILAKLFGEKAFHFLIQCFLGLGRTSVAPLEEHERKSVGTESTFGDMTGTEKFRDQLRHTAEELEGDLKRTQFKGRTLVLKIKLHTYEVLTRQTVPPYAVSTADDLYRFSLPMLSKLEREIPNMRLRLMGLRCTSLVSTAKSEVDFFGRKKSSVSTSMGSEAAAATAAKRPTVDDDGWQVWPEEEFEAAARQEREDELEEMQLLSQEVEAQEAAVPEQSAVDEAVATVECPVCGFPQSADDRALNEHIDLCLSRQAIKEVARESAPGEGIVRPASTWGTKRNRVAGDGVEAGRNVKKKLFFS